MRVGNKIIMCVGLAGLALVLVPILVLKVPQVRQLLIVERQAPRRSIIPTSNDSADLIALLDWPTHNAKELKISFRYPPDWKVIKNGDSMISVVPPEKLDLQNKFGGQGVEFIATNLAEQTYLADKTLEGYVNFFLDADEKLVGFNNPTKVLKNFQGVDITLFSPIAGESSSMNAVFANGKNTIITVHRASGNYTHEFNGIIANVSRL